MANPPRKKGTSNENDIREKYLLPVWPSATRAPLRGVNDYGDFLNVGGILIEAKKRKKLTGEWVKWVNTALSKTRWAAHQQLSKMKDRPSVSLVNEYADRYHPFIIFASGDRRTDPNIDLAIMPALFARQLLLAVRESGSSLLDEYGDALGKKS